MTRAESVSNAVAAVGTELVAIHDAARPLVTPELIEEVVAALAADPGAAGAIAAAPLTDTIKRVGRKIERTLTCLTCGTFPSPSIRHWSVSDPGRRRRHRFPGRRRSARALAAEPERLVAATDEAMMVEAAG